MPHNPHNPGAQMSDATVTMIFLTLSGGFQDAYTLLMRDGVFANAQTGNIVLMTGRIVHGDFGNALRYLVPLTAFALGVLATERLRARFRAESRLHWRQTVLLIEMLFLAIVGWIPATLHPIANALVSFVCAMQVQAFRTVRGNPYASTMCIGNLRSGMESLDAYLRTRETAKLRVTLRYSLALLCFAVGAGLGSWLSPILGLRAIWLCCVWLMISFVLMHHREAPETP